MKFIEFYIDPPEEQTTLWELEESVAKRRDVLLNLCSGTDITSQHKNILKLNSTADFYAHVALKFLSTNSPNNKSVFIQGETLLFAKRLERLKTHEVQAGLLEVSEKLSALHKHYNNDYTEGKLNNFLRYLLDIRIVIQDIQRFFWNHPLSEKHTKCLNGPVKLSWKLAPGLVSTHTCDMHKGKVQVYCKNFHALLCDIFQTSLLLSIDCRPREDVDNFLKEDGIKQIAEEICLLSSTCSEDIEPIKVTDIEDLSLHFPLCMKKLYQKLKIIHRLSHDQRYHLTIFLKKIGVTFEDSMLFWRFFYSKPTLCEGVCAHSWYDNEKKYIYSIKHAYGLVGSKKDYSMVNCIQIQDNDLCPFKDIDLNNSWKRFLPSFLQNKPEAIQNIKNNCGNPSVGCKSCLNEVQKHFSAKFQQANVITTDSHTSQLDKSPLPNSNVVIPEINPNNIEPTVNIHPKKTNNDKMFSFETPVQYYFRSKSLAAPPST